MTLSHVSSIDLVSHNTVYLRESDNIDENFLVNNYVNASYIDVRYLI